MPYNSASDLPDSVRENLPQGAQKIYKEAFNNAWDQYSDRDDRESVSHRVAWSAVKKEYKKQGDRWVRK